jgi:hypothetical protein
LLDRIRLGVCSISSASSIAQPDPLDQLAREVVRVEVAGADPLPVHDRAVDLVLAVGHYEYLRHESPLPLVGFAGRFKCRLPV